MTHAPQFWANKLHTDYLKKRFWYEWQIAQQSHIGEPSAENTYYRVLANDTATA